MGWLQCLDLKDNIGSVVLHVEQLMGEEVDDAVCKRLGDLADAALKLPEKSLAGITSLLFANRYRFSNKGLNSEFCFADCLMGRRYGSNTGVILYLSLAEECNVPIEVFSGYSLHSDGDVVDVSGVGVKSDVVVNRRQLLANHVVDLAGNLFLKNRFLEKEFECYQLAVDLDPLNFVALHRLSVCCYNDENFGGALHYLGRALRIRPDDVDALSLKAFCDRLYNGSGEY